jgi:hypothetical protein
MSQNEISTWILPLPMRYVSNHVPDCRSQILNSKYAGKLHTGYSLAVDFDGPDELGITDVTTMSSIFLNLQHE